MLSVIFIQKNTMCQAWYWLKGYTDNKAHVGPSPCRDRTYKEKQNAMRVRGREREETSREVTLSWEFGKYIFLVMVALTPVI